MRIRIFTAAAVIAMMLGWACVPSRPAGTVTYVKKPYVQQVTADSLTVMWETAEPQEAFFLFDGKREQVRERRTIHAVTRTGLQPGTAYTYRVNDAFSGTVATLPAERSGEYTVAIYGDSRSNPEVHRKAAAVIAAMRPVFAVHTGDLVSKGLERPLWDTEFFSPAADLLAGTCVYPVIGNHEQNSPFYFDFFDLPGNERYYTVDAGSAHFVFLDSTLEGEAMAAQAAWLAADLAADDHPWKLAVCHHPAFSSTGRGLNAAVAETIMPILFRGGVQFLFAGHDHHYVRSRPIIGPDGHAMIQIVAGGGGAPLYDVTANEFTMVGEKKYHVCALTIGPNELKGRVLDLDGAVIDAFTCTPGTFKADDGHGIRYGDVVAGLKLKKGLAILAAVAGPVIPNTRLTGTVTVGKAPFADIECRVKWEWEGTTWHVTPGELRVGLNQAAETVIPFGLDYWGEVYPAPRPVVTLVSRGREYPLAADLILPPFREITVTEMHDYPAIDGNVTAAESAGLAMYTGFIKDSANVRAAVQTRFCSGVFGQSLYFGIINSRPGGAKMMAPPRNDDEDVWQDDCNELFLMLPEASGYYQFILNAAGSKYDGQNKDKKWNGIWQGAAVVAEDAWSAEFLIPIKLLGRELAPGEDLVIRFNLCRNNPGSGEYSQWCRTYGSSHSPEYFGKGIILRK